MAEKDVDPVSSPPPSDIANEPSKSLEESSSPFSRLGLFYINSLIDLGYKRELVHTDLGPVSERDKCLPLFEKFFGLWELEMKKPLKKQSLWMVLWRTVGFGRLFLALFLYACSAAAAYGPILILSALVIYFENPNASNRAPISTIWIYVALMFVLPMASSIFAAQSNIIFAHIGLQFRNALVNMIYRKALKLSPASRQKQSTGMIVNMFSNDTKQLQQFTYFMNNCAIAPFQIIVSLVLIYYEVGPATFVGLGMMFLVIPLNLYIFITLNRLRQKKVKKTDIRVKLMNEILSGIRVIKFYAWESPFMSSVLESRREELVILKQMAYIVAVGFTLVLQALPVVQPVLVFYTFIKLGNELTAAIAFTTISLFNLMQFPFAFLPLGLAQYSQSLVSTQRMHKFFLSDELDPYVNRNDESLPVDVAIKLDNLSVCWVKAEDVTVAADKDDSKVAIVADAQTALEASPDDAKESEPLPDHVADETEPLQLHSEHDLKDDTYKGEDSQAVRDAIDADKAARINQIIQNRMMVDMGMTLKKTASVYTSDPENLGRSRSLMGYESIRPMQDGQQVDSINRSASTLMDVSLTIKQGQLVAVVGTVGSGKSSFLSAILGEMHCQEGSVSLFGSVAYCEQRPWILNATVLENILFGDPLIPARLDAAIHAANLEDDIRVLQGGLQTEIGERGINLSGGQKARVALARAVYKNCDIYLLDDPLSAVDVSTMFYYYYYSILFIDFIMYLFLFFL